MIRRSLSSGPGYGYTDQYSVYYDGSGGQQTVGPVAQKTSINQVVSEGWAIPDFTKRRKAGDLLPLTPWDQFQVYGRASGFYEILHDLPSGSKTCIEPGGSWVYYPYIITRAELEAQLDGVEAHEFVQAAAAKIYASGYDALTFIAELRDTVRMFRGIVPQIADLIRRRKRDPRWDPSDTLGDVANKWMEGRYGWRTLMYDLEDLKKLLADIGDKRRRRWSESVGSTNEWTETEVVSCSSAYATWDVNVATQWQLGVRGTVIADIDPPRVAFNPALTAWELTKLSFVVDWLVNIGGWLESLSFLAYKSEYVAAAGYYVRGVRHVTVSNAVPVTGNAIQSLSMDHHSTASLTLRVPTTVSKLPQVSLNLDWLKSLDLLALLKQAISK